MIYLDYNATTPIDKRVLDKMMPYLTDFYGNPSSPYELGEQSKEAIENSREIVARHLGVGPENIFFTNSATEAINIIISHFGGLEYEVITTPIEHSAVLNAVKHYPFFTKRQLAVDRFGNPSLEHLQSLLPDDEDPMTLVCVMTANNEIGTINNIKAISNICKKKKNIFLFTDAVQALGKLDLCLDVDAAAFSAHKIYGPKGVGALYIKDPDKINPLTHGGYQNTFVSGTENVAGIVGFGEAVRILRQDNLKEIETLRNTLLGNLRSHIPDLILNGPEIDQNRLINNINVTIPGVPSDAIILGLEDVMVSGASACTSGSGEIIPSYVLERIGCDEPGCSIRMAVGRFTTPFEIRYASEKIVDLVKAIRGK